MRMEATMLYNSREAAIKDIEETRKRECEEFKQWSDPIYPCLKCGGNMRMNMLYGITLTCIPPIHKNIYQCDECGFQESL